MRQKVPCKYHKIILGTTLPLTRYPSNAEDLSPSDWQDIIKTNKLLHGFQIREVNRDIVRARMNGG